MKIGILTTFSGSDEAYSLVVVVKTQLQMLERAGFQPALFVCPPFSGEGVFSDKITDIRRTVSGNSDRKEIAASLEAQIEDIDVMICHDIVFLKQHEEWARAILSVGAKHPEIAWVHWQHSRGDGLVSDHPKNSWFAYPNEVDIPHCAEINKIEVGRVRYVPHPLDFSYLGWQDLAIKIAEDFDFPFVDVSGILPARLDRHKQVEKAVRIYAGLKRAGKSVCFLIADAYATGERFRQYKKEVTQIAREQGLTENEFAFLGERYKECEYGTQRPTVKALYEMSNLFIQPSNAETSSLVALEAALAGALLVLNADFPPILPLYGKALALPFGSVLQAEPTRYFRHVKTADGGMTKVEDPQLFWDEQAKNTILPALDSQFALTVKRQQFKERWPSKVFQNHMLPLLQEAYNATPHVTLTYEPQGDPEVTAIITTLDNLPLLQQQIPVLQAECGRIIVVNNGSKDGTKEWLDTLLEAYPDGKYQVIHRENKGAGPGRNAGINLWNGSTPYALFVDGGILPPIGGVALLKDYLTRHPDVDVISPELASCFTTDESLASLRVSGTIEQTFPQRCLSSTAYCLTNQRAWQGLRFSEEGPFGEPGWGVDDNEMAYRWDAAGVNHQDFTNSVSGWLLYRRASGSFQRLFEETGIWPNQYGSVFEKRVVKAHQDWRCYYSPAHGWTPKPAVSYVIQGVPMPDFARLIKRLHETDPNHEIICTDDSDLDVKWWLDTFALRQPWGDTTIDPDGKILRRGTDYPDELWSGNVVRNRGPHGDTVITIAPDTVGEYL